MLLDLGFLARKLTGYREQFQESTAELAEATGIPEASLAAYERGEREPSGDEILILADHYKCDYRYFVSSDRVAPFDEIEVLFRSHDKEFSKEDRWSVLQFLYLCDCEEFLLDALAREPRRPFAFTKEGTSFKGQGRQAAAALREHLGHGPERVADVYRDVRSLGLHVFRRELRNSRISGLCMRHPQAHGCILVNYGEDPYRQRFTAAHELAHALLDDEPVVVSFVSHGGTHELPEVRANAFASAYLLPPDALRRLPDPGRWTAEDAVRWASQMQVSTEALAHALDEAGRVSLPQKRIILGARVPAHRKEDPELPQTLAVRERERREELLRLGLSASYVSLCFDAYEASAITAGRLAEALLGDERNLGRMAELYGRHLDHSA